MPSKQGHTAPAFTLGQTLYRIALTALAQATLVLIACTIVGSMSARGVDLYLRSAVLAFSLVGSYALGRAIRAERSLAFDRACDLYALALVNHFVAYASIIAHRLLGSVAGS